VASGIVKVDSSRKRIQHQEGGVIREIHVRDGARVKAGEVLVTLDETRAGASFGVLQAEYDSSLAEQARLVAERDDKPSIQWPAELQARAGDPKVAEIMQSQRTLFEARRTSLAGQIGILERQIVSKQSEIQGLVAQQQSKETQLASMRTELAGLTDLVGKGMVEKTRIRNVEREIARLEGERGEHVSNIAALRSQIAEKELQKFQIRKGFREEVVGDMKAAQSAGFDITQRMSAAKYVLENTEIRSPVDGTVVDLKAHTEGGVIAPGEVLMEIVPSGDRLMVEARVRPEDIDRVHTGLEAGVRLHAFDRRKTPEVSGSVTYVSADVIEDPKLGMAYFMVRVEVSPAEMARLGDNRVQPGMLADVFVRTGERTFLGYLLEPITSSFSKAWRER
jgi:HlyD family type I secretion membrane fusion protein